MPAIARNGDICGGAISATATKTTVNDQPVARIGDQVASHGDSPHDSAVMVEGSSTVIVEGIGVCREGDAASCGHTIELGAGSPSTNAG